MATAQTQVTGTIVDSNRQPVTNATIWFQAISSATLTPLSYQNGAGNTVVVPPVSAHLGSDGKFSLPLDDTGPTRPAKIGYGVTITDDVTGKQLLGVGYGCIQPTGATWDLYQYDPLAQPGVTVVSGPPGPGYYDLAVANGYTGTVQDFLATLAGNVKRMTATLTDGVAHTWAHNLATECPGANFFIDNGAPAGVYYDPLVFPDTNTCITTIHGFSGPVTAAFSFAPPIVVPTNLVAVGASGQVDLTWSYTGPAFGFTLYYGTSPNVTPTTGIAVSGIAASARSYALTTGANGQPLAVGTTFYFILTAETSNGESPSTATVSAAATPVVPVHHWMANEGSGATFHDSGTSPTDATSQNAPQWLTGVANFPTPLPVWTSNAVHFTTSAPNTFATASPFSISLWTGVANGDANNLNIFLATSNSTGTLQGIAFGVHGNKIFVQIVSDATANKAILVSAVDTLDMTTNPFVGVSYDGSGTAAGVKLYVNGSPVASTVVQDALGGGSISNSNPICLGSYLDGAYVVAGAIMRISIWSVNISDQQFAAEYAKGGQ